MINKNQLRELVDNTLREMGHHSPAAVNLILGTIAQESAGGTYLHQLGGGPALGIVEMEPNTHKDIWKNFLAYKSDLASAILRTSHVDKMGEEFPAAQNLLFNLRYAICMCRAFYLRVSAPLPEDLDGQARYWKQYYNTPAGAGTVQEYIHHYNEYVA